MTSATSVTLQTGDILRAAHESDRADMYQICLSTGSPTHENLVNSRYRNMLGEIYVGPHLTFSQEFAYVLSNSQVGGYVVAVLNTDLFEATLVNSWWPKIIQKYEVKELSSEESALYELMVNPVLTDQELVAKYPSHLHINLLENFQGKKIGEVMMLFMMNKLRSAGSIGIHLRINARNDRAFNFYSRLGFNIFSKSKNEWILVKSL